MSSMADCAPTPPEAMATVPSAPRRADAVRNRQRIVHAAVQTFASAGLDATVPEIAAAAGVGKASVYRNFPTKADLVAAVVLSEGSTIAGTITALAQRSAERDDLPLAVSTLFSALAGNSLLADALASDRGPVSTELLGALGSLIERGKRAGSVRQDVLMPDVEIILCGAVRQLRATDVREPERWERAAHLVVRAFAA